MSFRWSFWVGLVLGSWSAVYGEPPAGLDWTAVRAIPVQHDGRWPPLDTLARDMVESVTGDAFYQGRDAVGWLLAWTFDGEAAEQARLIRIKSGELRGELGLPADRTDFSFAELVAHARVMELIRALDSVEKGQKLDPLESKVNDIKGKLLALQGVVSGQTIKLVPDANDPLGPWHAVPSALPTNASGQIQAVHAAWSALRQAFLAADASAFESASGHLTTSAAALPSAHAVDPARIATELRYNALRPFRTAWMAMLIGAVLALSALLVRRRWMDGVAVAGMTVGFVLLTYGLWLRWQIAGRIPASNMFESLLFLSWGMGVFAILSMLVIRHRMVPLTASGMGALALILADVLPMDHFIRPIAPVLLDTIWMSIHVPIIMVSYSVLALAVLIAHVQLVVMAAAPARHKLADTIDGLQYWYIHVGSILLILGIITGSMWAASSWGRYWGWDPKEVWSLVAFLGYLVILHVRVDHERVPGWAYGVAGVLAIGLLTIVITMLRPTSGLAVLGFVGTGVAMIVFVMARGQFATALKSILAFWLIIMTYVGVNYVLGTGLHSYGFGTGAVVRNMFRIGTIDLILTAVCCVVYLARRPRGGGFVTLSPAKL